MLTILIYFCQFSLLFHGVTKPVIFVRNGASSLGLPSPAPLSVLALYWFLISGCPGAAVLKVAGSSSGLQLPVLFKMLGSCSYDVSGGQSGPRSYGASRGGWLGPRSCSVASLRRGHLASCLASTMRTFGASTSPISTAKASWGQPPPASSEFSSIWSGNFKWAGCSRLSPF
jgi:hypothetical protein